MRLIDRVEEYAIENGLSKKTREYSRRDEDKFRRYYLMYYLKSKGYGSVAIGNAFGLDHATVLHGIKQYYTLNRYLDFQEKVEDTQYEFPLLDGIYADSKHIRVTDSLYRLQSEINKRMKKSLSM